MSDEMVNVGGIEADFRIDSAGVAEEFARLKTALAEAEGRLNSLQSQLDRVSGVAGNAAASQDRLTSSVNASAAAFDGQMKAVDDVANMMLAMFAKEEAAAAKAEAAENARLEKLASANEARLAREDAAKEAAALKDAERLAKLAEQAERFEAKQAADKEAAALRDAERLARMATAAEAFEARQAAASEAAALKEAERLARLAADYEAYEARRQAAMDRRAVEGGNFVIQQMTIQPDEVQRLVAAEQADVVAKRQMQNAAVGVMREQYHLNQVLREGADQINVAETATVTASAAYGGLGASMRSAGAGAKAMGDGHQELMSRSAAAGRAMMQFGYIIDDIQYGFQAIVNNTAPFVQSIAQVAGVSATTANALGAVAQVLGVLAYQAYKRWDDIREKLREGFVIGGIDGTDRLKEQLKEIEKAIEAVQKKGKVFSLGDKFEYEENVQKAAKLKQEIDDRKEVEKTTEGKGKREREAASGFTEAVRESGGKAALDELERAYMAKTLDPKFAEESMLALGVKPAEAKKRAASGVVADEQDNAFRTPEEMARKEFARASRGDEDAAKRIRRAVDEESLSYGAESKFAERIDKYSPDTQSRMKENERRAKNEDEARRNTERAEKEKASNANKARQAEEADLKGVEQFRKKKLRDDVEKAGEAVPGLGKETENDVMKAMVQGRSLKDVERVVKEKLRATDEFKDDDEGAGAVAEETVKDARKKVGEKVAARRNRDEGKDEKPEKASRSEVYGGADLTSRIQSAISDRPEETKKQTGLQERMVDYLAKLVDNRNGVVQVKVKK